MVQTEGGIPVFDLADCLTTGSIPVELAQGITRSFQETGCVVVRDPRVDADQNDIFLDMMERYFEQSDEQKLKDARPELHHQVTQVPQQGIVLLDDVISGTKDWLGITG